MTNLPQAYLGSEPYVSISYAPVDADKVSPIIQGMLERGFRVWHGADESLDTIAEHLTQCQCIIVFVTAAGLETQSLRREINFSIDLNKNLLVVYLEDVTLSAGMRLQLGTIQAMFRQRHNTLASFLDELLDAKILKGCFTPVAPTAPAEYIEGERIVVPEGLTAESYYQGGVKENFLKHFDIAAEWFRAAAQKGSVDAMCWLGFYYDKELVKPKDQYESKDYWLRKASNKGSKTARGILNYQKAHNTIFRKGEISGDTTSLVISITQDLKESAKKGDPIAQYYLSIMYRRHYVITILPRSDSWYLDQSCKWKRKAEEQGLVDKRT